MGSVLRSVGAVVSRIEDYLAVAALVSLIVMVLITVADVVLRYALHRPIPGVYEAINYYLMPISLVLIMASCQKFGDHIKIDIFRMRMPKTSGLVADTVALGGGCVVALAVAIYGISPMIEVYQQGQPVPGRDWPLWPAYATIPVGFGLLAIRLALQLAARLSAGPDGEIEYGERAGGDLD